jgi:hypothetical protein
MDEDELDPEMRDTLRARLAKKTRKSYEDTLTRFFRFLFDNLDDHQGIFQENFLLRIGVAAAEDSARRTARGQPCKSRPSFNAEARRTIKNIRPEDPETHPICFEKLSFVVFARWLKTFRKSVKRSRGDAEPDVLAFDADVLDGGDATSTITVRLSASAYDNACSSLAFLFVECDCSKDYSPVSKNLWRKITLYKKGCRRESAKECSDLGLRTAEGKDPLPLACLIYLCKFLHRSKDPEHVAALLFLLRMPMLTCLVY